MKITVNGKELSVNPDTRLNALLEELKIEEQGMAVELNMEVVPKSRYKETLIKNNDTLEIIRMTGGG